MAAAIATLFCSCSREDYGLEIEGNSFAEGDFLPREITIDLGEPDTRLSHQYGADDVMKSAWELGDPVYVAPAGKSGNGGIYRVTAINSSKGTFKADNGLQGISFTRPTIFYYPGDKIHNDVSFANFSYEGQVQSKSDPMAHLSAYHTMRQVVNTTNLNPTGISFSGCYQSGCMRIILSGAEFRNPRKVELKVMSGGQAAQNAFVSANFLSSYYIDDSSSEIMNGMVSAESLSIGLDGYGTEDGLVVYMMHSNCSMTLPAGVSIRVTVTGDNAIYADVPLDSQVTIRGGYCSTLTVSEGWTELEGDFTEYPWDGDVVVLQENGAAHDLVIMGDGFIKEDFDDGTYDTVMRQAYDAFFSIHPLTVFKNDFNVYYVKTVSPQRIEAENYGNGAENTGKNTKFSCTFTPNSTLISGDNSLALQYAKSAFTTNANERIKNATVIVMANQECRAGTCYNQWEGNTRDYGRANAVAYCSLGNYAAEFTELVHHEACGHGFGKLGDEYYYTGAFSFSTAYWTNLANQHALGLFRNVDKYVTEYFNQCLSAIATDLTQNSDVLWYDMIGTANGYENEETESLGFYEGAYTYPVGFCRPTEYPSQSVMYGNTGRFNAISRRQMYYRYLSIKGDVSSNIFGTAEELNAFLEWDRQYFDILYRSTQEAPAVRSTESVRLYEAPLAPPVYTEGRWIDGVFHPLQ